jgi:hypothetical protein
MKNEILNEQLKKFRMLSEYAFYLPKEELTEDEDEVVDGSEEMVGDETDMDVEMTDDSEIEAPSDIDTETEETSISGLPSMEDEIGAEVTPEGEVEIDITDLVKNTDEIHKTAIQSNEKIEDLLTKYDELMGRIETMDKISNKIDSLEKELETRVPTPKEKMEMVSLKGYPYTVKLSDFWDSKSDRYDVGGTDDTEQEYKLTQDEIDSDYNETDIKQSFSVDSDYEEEEF